MLRIENIEKDEQVIEIEQIKGGKPHTVPTRDDLLLRLEHWLKAGRKEWAGHVDSEYVFPISTIPYLKSNKDFSSPVAKIAEKAGIQEQSRSIRYGPSKEEVRRMRMFTPYTLRHSTIAHLKSNGVSDDLLRRFAGHVDVSTTRRYFKKAGELELFNSTRETVGRL